MQIPPAQPEQSLQTLLGLQAPNGTGRAPASAPAAWKQRGLLVAFNTAESNLQVGQVSF